MQELVNRYNYPEEEPQAKIETLDEAEIRWKQFQEKELMMQAMLPKYYIQGNQKVSLAQERQIDEEQPKYECQLSIKKICKLFLINSLVLLTAFALAYIYGFIFQQ